MYMVESEDVYFPNLNSHLLTCYDMRAIINSFLVGLCTVLRPLTFRGNEDWQAGIRVPVDLCVGKAQMSGDVDGVC